VNVRAATSADVPVLEALWRAFEGEVPPPAHVELDLARELAELRKAVDDGLAFVAEVDGEAVGFALARRTGSRLARLTDLYVVPEARRGGVAAALVHAVVEAVAPQGIEHLEASAYDKYDFVNAFQVRTVSEPTKMDAVTMVAIVAAFGSQSVRECHKAWRMAVDDIDLEHRILQWNWEQNGDPEALITLDEQKKLQSELKPLELTTRQALADAIGAELNESLLPRR